MVGIALLGAGLYAEAEHLPAIEASTILELKAVYSRSQKSADGLAGKSRDGAAVYFDSPATAGKSLDDVLARHDIAAVIVCLPIMTQAEVIKKALGAGKHVLSEKPIAHDAATAQALIDWLSAQPKPPVWAVGENFRFMKAITTGAERVKELGGQLVTFHVRMATLIQDDNKFWNTPWRKVPEYQGGFLLDGGIHHLAGLRALIGATGQEIDRVACFSRLLQKKLLPVDSVYAVASTKDEANGTISISFGTEAKSGLEIEIVTTTGRVTWTPADIKVARVSDAPEPAVDTETFEKDSGVKAEVEAFGQSLGARTVDPRQSPAQGLGDLKLLEALLRSGEAGAAVKTIS